MSPKPLLKDIQFSLSGACTCGDQLFAPATKMTEVNTLETAMKGLQSLFRSHLVKKHPDFVQEAP